MFEYKIVDASSKDKYTLAYGQISFVPRIGETLEILSKEFKVTNVVYEMNHSIYQIQSVRIEVTRV